MKVGLFFGSFNPVHIAHMIIANYMANDTDLAEVWMVVSPLSPFKNQGELVSEEFRLKLIDLAIGDNSKIKSSDAEFRLPRPSYTIDTLNFFDKKYPEIDFVIIMGEDNLHLLHKWRSYDRIIKNYDIYIYRRQMVETHDYSSYKNITFFDVPLLNISSTYIRERLQKKESIQYLVPDAVFKFLDETQVYLPESYD